MQVRHKFQDGALRAAAIADFEVGQYLVELFIGRTFERGEAGCIFVIIVHVC